MNKADLVSAVADSTGFPKNQVERTIEAANETIIEQLKTGREVNIRGFGAFSVQFRDQRKGRNPRTGETMVIPSSRAARFKASPQVTEALNKR